ncbi:MAG: DNA alkylation repair protein, partial [Duncaniella sp.]|nr:DNA alkylation repair protein [Duncaniella sp.]
SCEYILGPYLYYNFKGENGVLRNLAASENLWEQRIAVVTTFYFIRQGLLTPTFEICDLLLGNPHDLIHKAMGWMLREVGKRDKPALMEYLESRISRLPRTTLRYAIERFSHDERREWLDLRNKVDGR